MVFPSSEIINCAGARLLLTKPGLPLPRFYSFTWKYTRKMRTAATKDTKPRKAMFLMLEKVKRGYI